MLGRGAPVLSGEKGEEKAEGREDNQNFTMIEMEYEKTRINPTELNPTPKMSSRQSSTGTVDARLKRTDQPNQPGRKG